MHARTLRFCDSAKSHFFEKVLVSPSPHSLLLIFSRFTDHLISFVGHSALARCELTLQLSESLRGLGRYNEASKRCRMTSYSTVGVLLRYFLKAKA